MILQIHEEYSYCIWLYFFLCTFLDIETPREKNKSLRNLPLMQIFGVFSNFGRWLNNPLCTAATPKVHGDMYQ